MPARLVALLLLGLLLVLHGQLWSGRGSVGDVADMKRRLQLQQQRNAAAQQENARLAAEVRDLKEGLEMVEEQARRELGMVKPNEIFVHVRK